MKKIASFLTLLILVVGCKGDVSDRSTKDYFSAFLNGNEAMVAFGSADLNTLLEKSDYESQPKIGALLKGPVGTIKSSFDLTEPVFYALEGPFVKGNPTSVHLFLKVKNADSLKAELLKNGFDLLKSKSNDFEYFQDGDLSMGIENNLAVAVIKNGDYNGQELLASAFKRSKGDMSTDRVGEILAYKSDVVLGMSVASLYNTSNTDLSKLDSKKQKELKELLDDCFIENTVSFENGAAIFESRNHFSPKLQEKMFFASNGGPSVISKLGKGTPRFGITCNIDMKKIQSFVDEYSPEALDHLSSTIGGPFSLAMMTSGNDLASIVNGKLGLVMVGDPNQTAALIPDFNFFLGLGERGKALGEFGKEMIASQFAEINLTDEGLSGFTSMDYVPNASGKLNIPAGCEVFGQKPITAFVNLDGLDMSSFELEGEANLIKLVKYATFEYDENGGKLVIMAKEGKENMLKQAIQLMLKELESEISTMNF